ncbi:uncharacterized protein LOC135714041, partial [Ochlerotatus camptorhynchus]|uniref:uncharacterized protein LOC135714041 n=1 Tax=Ochlerotatus camptorhynchus TaxID=644619 RepID=UPI0031DD1F96
LHLLSVDAAKKRWRSLRDRFVREARRLVEQSRSGAGEDSSTSSWPFFEELKFLQSHTEARPTSSNYQDKSVFEEGHGQDTEHINSDSESSLNLGLNITTPSVTPTAKSSRRRKQALDTDEHFQCILEKVEQRVEGWSAKKSRHESFCKYIGDRLEMLPEQVARSLEVEFILRVNQSIDEFNHLIETDDDVICE